MSNAGHNIGTGPRKAVGSLVTAWVLLRSLLYVPVCKEELRFRKDIQERLR